MLPTWVRSRSDAPMSVAPEEGKRVGSEENRYSNHQLLILCHLWIGQLL